VVAHVDVAGAVDRHAVWAVELGCSLGSTCSVRVPGLAVAGDGRDVARWIDAPDSITAFGDDHVSEWIDGHRTSLIELRGGSRTIGESCVAVAGQGRDVSSWVDLADEVVLIVSDVNVARGIEAHAQGSVELGGAGLAIGVAQAAASDCGPKLPEWIDLADTVVLPVGDEHVAGVIKGDPEELEDNPLAFSAREGCDVTQLVNSPDSAVVECVVDHQNASRAVECEGKRVIKLGRAVGSSRPVLVRRNPVSGNCRRVAARIDLANSEVPVVCE